MSNRTRWILVFLSVTALTTFLYLPFTEAKRGTPLASSSKNPSSSAVVPKLAPQPGVKAVQNENAPYSSQAVAFAETANLRDLKAEPLTPDEMEKFKDRIHDEEKNEANTRKLRSVHTSRILPFRDLTLIWWKIRSP